MKRKYGVQIGVFGECVCGVVENGIVVVGESKRVDLVLGELVEVVLLTGHDVFGYDLNVLIPIGPCVFVPEADDVAELVDDDAELVAVFSDADRLGAVAAFAYEGATTTGALGEHDVVWVLFWLALDEPDAGVVLPVAHGRTEERGAFVGEQGVDLVGYHCLVPESVLSSGGGSARTNRLLVLFRHRRRLDGNQQQKCCRRRQVGD